MPTTQRVGLVKNELLRRCKRVHKQRFKFYSGNSRQSFACREV